jgi:glycosyltransferase involved in cell wall biosynthesis
VTSPALAVLARDEAAPVPPPLPSIGVVIPSLDQGRYLPRALASLFEQGYPRLRVVVMDGGSTDESVDVIRAHADRLAFWRSGRDGGQAAAVNEGVRRLGTQLVAWLNADDFYLDGALWVVGRAWAAFPGRALYVGNGLRYRQDEDRYVPFCRRHLTLRRDALRRGLDYVLQPSTFFRAAAWAEEGGLDPALRYCMDWDLVLRLAERHPAVLVNEFLSASREHGASKTSTGGMARAEEIRRLAEARGGARLTPGAAYYLLEALLEESRALERPGLRRALYEGMLDLQQLFRAEWGNLDGFPEAGDPQDQVYLTVASPGDPPRPPPEGVVCPRISLVTPSYNQAAFLGTCLDSALSQGYPELELLVVDGGSTDGSVDVIRERAPRLASWVSEPDGGPAHAVNKGFARATGEVLGWLNSDDALAQDALWHVGRAFAEDPDLDMVFGNALYIDGKDGVFLADHGWHRTGLYFGERQPWERIPYYWSYVHGVPQPSVFFRRRLLERCGGLDEGYRLIFDFELFWRFTREARVRKLERTLAFYRIHPESRTGGGWRAFQVELYRFSRPRWPRAPRAFYPAWRDFVGCYMRHRYHGRPRGPAFWAVAAAVAASALTGLGNPEAWDLPRPSR